MSLDAIIAKALEAAARTANAQGLVCSYAEVAVAVRDALLAEGQIRESVLRGVVEERVLVVPLDVAENRAASRFRADGWPLCPVCDEDELADLTHDFARRDARLYCYRCNWRGFVDLTNAPPVVSRDDDGDAT